ncbi:putative glucoamylase [Mobilisporobacter senegalensis]|uniref:Putative glucoamylase n=1 Tax=Mobilisporobacter senegalensis TaxID=1329262 RepID=A0A3N1XKC3_9FIRM|nr:glucoamylase family protein [Mobilisporobacter senegalensis]ROR27116.1 putative glucoamylase [Mobilisporobacter senegalensis]
MDESVFIINMPEITRVIIILIILACLVLMMLYFRFNHYRKRVNIKSIGITDKFGPKEWEQQMRDLALDHKDVKPMRFNFVLDDYNQIAYKRLNRIRNNISGVSADIIALIPAARWLFDNFQMLYREIKNVRNSGTSYEILPILRNKEFGGFPRIYIVAKRMVALSGGHLNEDNIEIMLKAYQSEIHLTDKELWALPEMIKFCLLESIIEVAEDIINIINVKNQADKYVKGKIGEGQEIRDINIFLRDIETNCKDNYSFHSHVIYLLKNMSYDDISLQEYLDYYFPSNSRQIKPSNIFLEEGKIESYLETNIRALIVSLREINEVDAEKFFGEFSYLEQILSKDPTGVYKNMDPESKGMYRGVIVKLSLRYRISEEKIVNDCLELAMEGTEELYGSRHVGFYLLGKGYPILKAKVLNHKRPKNLTVKKNVIGFCYFVTLFFILFCLCYFINFMLNRYGIKEESYDNIISIIITIPLLFGISLEITNFLFTRRIRVKKIPSYDYLKEIPDNARTFVVMPVIISSKEQGLEYFERLEKHYLANRQPNLFFALLLDYADSDEACKPEDEFIKNALINRTNELNNKYPSELKRFCLFIRERKWNEFEKCYMGWERKRGKLEEFNGLLTETKIEDTTFTTAICDHSLLKTFKYIITLDADTNLIRDNAAKLVGLIDHPLNSPMLDPENKKLKEGYVIIQPSVRNHIVDKKGSHFAEIFGGQSGLAHYSSVISDIYQDIFNAGIYIGKGIYDVQAFHTLLHNVIPENSVLSHDLLESCYAKTAFSSSAKVMDTFPNSVISYVKREHRWIRGDWQLFPWLFKGKDKNGRGLDLLSKWKIFDNLRRSIVPLSKVLFIIINLLFIPKIYYLWLPFVFFGDIFNFIILIFSIIKQKILRPKLALVYLGFFRELGTMIFRAFMELILTPYRAYIATDAMIRTLYRVLISKRNLLMWNTSENVDASVVNTLKGYFRMMWSSFIPAIIILALMLIMDIPFIGVILYGVLIVIWVMAFYMAYQISQPKERMSELNQEEDNELLLDTARRTWQFFKDFTVKENNWLCPDNYQEGNIKKISDKTSPTNIGLQFLSIISARDFGFLTLSSTLNLVENLINTVVKLPKWNGHLYNWYHIKSLEILNPAYISTVDSGNFLGHLLALKNGLLEQIDNPVFSKNLMKEFRITHRFSNYDSKLKDDYEKIEDFLEDITDIWDDLYSRDLKPHEDPRWSKELLSIIESMVYEIGGLKLKETKFTAYPTLKELAKEDNKNAKAMMDKIHRICKQIDTILGDVDFGFLYNERRHLFHIGYHVSSHNLDAGCYDLMASESLLTSFLAIALGKVPLRHWYKLGRPLTMVKGIPCLVSWSGTMFEYLMPNLVLREYEGSVFTETSKAAVLQQMNYAKEMGIPWGISESQYYRFDLNSNYQYKAFGVPKLRLQPVRQNSMVVTPYATMLALEYAGEDCLINLKRLMGLGVFGEYGFYEAIDYNNPNAIEMTPYCIVKSFMAHHQGMNLIAINNYVNQGIIRKRFHAEPMIRATEVLLEEKRQSHLISIAKRGYTIGIGKIHLREEIYNNRYVNNVAPRIPVTNYLSNNRYSLMITSDGDGFSSYRNMMLYRWRADLYANSGNYIYIKDMTKGKYFSTTYHPTRKEPDEYQVVFSPHQAEFKRVDRDITTHTLVTLSPDYNIEIRKVSITNRGRESKQFEITSYLEVVSDSHLAELSHPAFNKLFIESEFMEEQSIFLSKRRSNKKEENPYIVHMVKTSKELLKKVEHENDRLKFIGRNNTLENPDVIVKSLSLSNQSGFCNDPIMSLRVNISLKEGETACVSFITGVCQSREEAIKIGDELNIPYGIDDTIEKFRLQSDIELKYLEITKPQLNAFQDLISPIFYPSNYYRGPEENIRRNFKNQSFLWKFGVSGDNPIMLLRVRNMKDAGLIKDVLRAYEYLRINRVLVDLIILSEAKHGYMQELDDLINDLTSSLRIYDGDNEKPSLFMLHSYQMIPAEIDLLYTVARVVFSRRTGIYFRNIKENLNELLVEDN